MTDKKSPVQIQNKKAFFDYEIIENFDAGIVLTGDEIKAIRAKRVNITGSYVKVINNEVFWIGGNFNMGESDNQRTKKLLLHEDEIKRLAGKSQERGYAIIPIKLYIKRGFAKLEIGLGKGKKEFDKRATLKKREQEREVDRKIKQF